MCAAAVAFGQAINYVGAGTVEFLVGQDGRFVFIEMNPRIQVEHTVTEETTDVDMSTPSCTSRWARPCPNSDSCQARSSAGFALQCRITTEDAANDFRPDTGRILAPTASPEAPAFVSTAAVATKERRSTPYFDSLLTKLPVACRTFEDAVARSRRAVAEFPASEGP